jgi:hypothetical protein
MPTDACRPERRAVDRSEQRRYQGREGADYLADCPGGYLPPSAERCRIHEMQEWIDLCA